MPATTIEIPRAHADAVRASLLACRDGREARPPVDRLLAQLAERGERPLRLTGPRALLWSTLYDALCATAEALAEECNEHWRDGDLAALRSRLAEVAAGLELLAQVGPPPRG